MPINTPHPRQPMSIDEYMAYLTSGNVVNDMLYYSPVEKPPELKKDPRLLKDLQMDVTDLILHLFKGQPRVCVENNFGYDTYFAGGRNYQRDTARFNGTYKVFYQGSEIAIVTTKHHKSVKILNTSSRPKVRYARKMFARYVTDLIPQARLEI